MHRNILVMRCKTVQAHRAQPWVLSLLFLVLAAMHAAAALGQPAEPAEYEVKAAFLYNFARYVKWPDKPAGEPGNAFVIGIIGTDPFGKTLDQMMQGKSIQGRAIVVRRYLKADEATGCDMLFISASEKDNLAKIFAMLRDAPVLTVGDMPQFAQRGGMINLVVHEKRVQFEVNIAAAERAGLTPGSQLLRLAKIVAEVKGGTER